MHHAHCLRRDACASRALFTSRCLCITRIVYVEMLVHHAHCLRRDACASRALFTSRCLCITRIVYVEMLVHHAHCLRRGACASRALHERSNCLHRSIDRCADMKARGSTAGPLSLWNTLQDRFLIALAGMDAIFVLCISPPPQLFLPLRSFSFPPLLWDRSLAFSLISELILLIFIAGNQHLSHSATQPLPLLQCLQGRTALICIKRSAAPNKHRRLV